MQGINVISPKNTSTMTSSSQTSDSAMFNPIDLEASLGRIEDSKRSSVQGETSLSFSSKDQHLIESNSVIVRTGVTRTSSRTPFFRETSDSATKRDSQNSLLKPYPISETDDEIKERNRLTEAVDWSNGLEVNTPPQTSMNAAESADQQSMMEVTVDDFVLSAEEAGSLADLDGRTIQDDPNSFWESPAHVVTKMCMNVSDIDMMASVPFSVTFSSQDPGMADIENDELTDAAPIRSVDMEW